MNNYPLDVQIFYALGMHFTLVGVFAALFIGTDRAVRALLRRRKARIARTAKS